MASGGKMSKRLGGIIGCMALFRFLRTFVFFFMKPRPSFNRFSFFDMHAPRTHSKLTNICSCEDFDFFPSILYHQGCRFLFVRRVPVLCCVCVCVFFPSILDIKFVGRTSRGHTGGRSHRIFNPPSFCGACLDFCREKDSAIPFPRRP